MAGAHRLRGIGSVSSAKHRVQIAATKAKHCPVREERGGTIDLGARDILASQTADHHFGTSVRRWGV